MIVYDDSLLIVDTATDDIQQATHIRWSIQGCQGPTWIAGIATCALGQNLGNVGALRDDDPAPDFIMGIVGGL